RTAARFPPGAPDLAASLVHGALTPLTTPLPTPPASLQQFGPGGGPWFVQVTQRLGTAFYRPWLTTLRAIPPLMAGQRHPRAADVPTAGCRRGQDQQPTEGVERLHAAREAQVAGLHSLLLRGRCQHPPGQVVRQEVSPDLLTHHRRRLTTENVHP